MTREEAKKIIARYKLAVANEKITLLDAQDAIQAVMWLGTKELTDAVAELLTGKDEVPRG